MNVGILVLLFFPLAIITGVTFTIWKFTHLYLDKYEVKHAKWIAAFICIIVLLLITFWLDSSLSGTRWFGC